MQFSFGTFRFPTNPSHIRFRCQHNIRTFQSPLMKARTQNLQESPRVVQVKGVFYDNMTGQYNHLYTLYRNKTEAVVEMGTLFSFRGLISKMQVQLQEGPEVMEYDIEFVEV